MGKQARTEDLRAAVLPQVREAVLADLELHCPFDASPVLGAGALWEAQCQILYVQIAEGVRCCPVSPQVFGWEF